MAPLSSYNVRMFSLRYFLFGPSHLQNGPDLFYIIALIKSNGLAPQPRFLLKTCLYWKKKNVFNGAKPIDFMDLTLVYTYFNIVTCLAITLHKILILRKKRTSQPLPCERRSIVLRQTSSHFSQVHSQVIV